MRDRCPLALTGANSPAMAACPGFVPGTVPTGVPGESVPGLVSCGHLVPRDHGRGFVAACGRPGGPPVDATDAEAVTELVWPGRGLRRFSMVIALPVRLAVAG